MRIAYSQEARGHIESELKALDAQRTFSVLSNTHCPAGVQQSKDELKPTKRGLMPWPLYFT